MSASRNLRAGGGGLTARTCRHPACTGLRGSRAGQHVWPARRYSRARRYVTYVSIISPDAEHPEQGAASKRRNVSPAGIREFLLALLVALLLELLALRKNGAIRSVGFRQRRTTHTDHLVDAHSVSARENAVARSPIPCVLTYYYACLPTPTEEADGNGYGVITGRSDPLGRRLE